VDLEAPYDAAVDVDGVVPLAHVARPFRLLPFRAITLQPSRIGNPASLRAFAGDRPADPERFRRWQLGHDDVAGVYLHEYTVGGITVRGLVGALAMDRRARAPEDVAVFPHEGIHLAQATQLARRMREMQANPAPILLVHRGRAEVRALMDRTQAMPAHRELTDHAGQHHRVWAIRDRDALAGLQDALAPAQAVIADGHHRYAAYLQLQEEAPGPATDAGLAMLVDHDDTPLHLGPIHRMIAGTTITDLAAAARRTQILVHDVEPEAALDRLAQDSVVATDGRRWVVLELELRTGRLAVEALHDELLPALSSTPTRIAYHHSVATTLADLRGHRGVALLLPAPTMDEVLDASTDERLLPEKATSFQPKPSVGVLIRSLRDG